MPSKSKGDALRPASSVNVLIAVFLADVHVGGEALLSVLVLTEILTRLRGVHLSVGTAVIHLHLRDMTLACCLRKLLLRGCQYCLALGLWHFLLQQDGIDGGYDGLTAPAPRRGFLVDGSGACCTHPPLPAHRSDGISHRFDTIELTRLSLALEEIQVAQVGFIAQCLHAPHRGLQPDHTP